MKKMSLATLLLVAATVLGATVLREPVADAASAVLQVNIVGPVDGDGNVKVHEQGTASVEGTVAARSAPPTSPWRSVSGPGVHEGIVTVIGPSDSPINLTSLTVSGFPGTDEGQVTLSELFVAEDATDCSIGSGGSAIWSTDRLSAPMSAAFPTPIQVSPRPGTKACIRASANTGFAAIVAASGFFGD